ncbi:HIGH-chlorophyll-fluorescence 101 [Tribonema minus]|uniref:HIGH-chlorophyll-fluorescence 101 n=1 Tax=Tribonema minus TaxID=303371 RepID=A0A835Z7N1_9STRA|nr:HIGH-chlorophyll-fluorescence 101 [Tribonema minus]
MQPLLLPALVAAASLGSLQAFLQAPLAAAPAHKSVVASHARPLRDHVSQRHHHKALRRAARWSQLRASESSGSEGAKLRREQVLDALKVIIDPDLGQDIVTLGFIKELAIDAAGAVSFCVELTTPACPVKELFKTQCQTAVEALPWVASTAVTMTAQPVSENKQLPTGLSRVQNIIAVSSCKGGVGKSTTAVNLAFALQSSGARVGILDADIYGPSLPTMVRPDKDVVEFVGNEIKPLEARGVKLMSYGYVNEGAAIMRGPMVVQLLQQFVTLTSWGDLDYLLIDMPPGTGDIQLTLCQNLNITAAVIVTTPQRLSFADVVKGIDMFDAVNIPSIAVVENMAYYNEVDVDALADAAARLVGSSGAMPADAEQLQALVRSAAAAATTQRQVFGRGHSKRLADMWGMTNVVRMPLHADVAAAGDAGVPFVVAHADGEHAALYRELAESVVREVAKIRYGRAARPHVAYDEARHLITIDAGAAAAAAATVEPAALRRACRCAACVEELTGRPLLDPASVPAGVRPLGFAPIGNYAVSVDWSDGHKSLYPYASFVEGYQGRRRRLAEATAELEVAAA